MAKQVKVLSDGRVVLVDEFGNLINNEDERVSPNEAVVVDQVSEGFAQQLQMLRPPPTPEAEPGAPPMPEPPPPTAFQRLGRMAIREIPPAAAAALGSTNLPTAAARFGTALAMGAGANVLGVDRDRGVETGANVGAGAAEILLRRSPQGRAASTLARLGRGSFSERLSGLAARSAPETAGAITGSVAQDFLFNPDKPIPEVLEVATEKGATIFSFGVATRGIINSLVRGFNKKFLGKDPELASAAERINSIAKKSGFNAETLEEGFGSTAIATGSRFMRDPSLRKISGIQRQVNQTIEQIMPSRFDIHPELIVGGPGKKGLAQYVREISAAINAGRINVKRTLDMSDAEIEAVKKLANMKVESMQDFFRKTFGTREGFKTEAIGALLKIVKNKEPQIARELKNEWLRTEFFGKSILPPSRATTEELVKLSGNEGFFDPQAMKSALNTMDERAVNRAFGPETLQTLKDYVKVIELASEPVQITEEGLKLLGRRAAWVASAPGVIASGTAVGAATGFGTGGAASSMMGMASGAGIAMMVINMFDMTRQILDSPAMLNLLRRAVEDKSGDAIIPLMRAFTAADYDTSSQAQPPVSP